MAVTITKPASGATLTGLVAVEATYTGKNFDTATVTVDGKQLASDSAKPIAFSIDTTRVPDGSHTLTVAVRYRTSGGNRRWQKASIPITTEGNDMEVVLSTNKDTSNLSGTVVVTATVTPSSQATTPVSCQFFVDNVLKATDTSYPLSFSWDTTTVTDGDHVLKAIVVAKRTKTKTLPVKVMNIVIPPEPPPSPPPITAVPVNTALPTISPTGDVTEGQSLSVSLGTWTNSPTSYTRQWLRCDAAGANAVLIPSATGMTYALAAEDVGKTIRCSVTAFNTFGASAAKQSAQTAVVAGIAVSVPTIIDPPVITGTPTQGYTLNISNGNWTDSPTSYARQWQRCDAVGANCVDSTTPSYDNEVLADTPFFYGRLGEPSGNTLDDSSGNNRDGSYGAATASPTLARVGALTGDTDTSADFDGVNDFASVALNLSSLSTITIEFWLNWDAFANNDDLVAEFTANYNSNNGGFIIDPNDAAGSFMFGFSQAGSYWVDRFVRPSAAVWHHYAFVLNRSAPLNKAWVDGIARTFTAGTHNGVTYGNFANSTLYLMSRAGTSLFGAGTLDEFAIYSGELSAARILAHYNARSALPAGEVGVTYLLTPTDVGKTIRCSTIATNVTGDSLLIQSAATAAVEGPPPPPPPAPPPATRRGIGTLRFGSASPPPGADRYDILVNSWDKAAQFGPIPAPTKSIHYMSQISVGSPAPGVGHYGITLDYCRANNLILKTAAGADVMNVSYNRPLGNLGHTLYQQEWARQVDARLTAMGIEGVFIDDTHFHYIGITNGAVPVLYQTQASWLAAVVSFAKAISAALRPRFYVAYNATGWYPPGGGVIDKGDPDLALFTALAPYADGLFCEYFQARPNIPGEIRKAGAGWTLYWDEWQRIPATCVTLGVDFLGNAFTNSASVRDYVHASLLLEADTRAKFMWSASSYASGADSWNATYDKVRALGAPTAAKVKNGNSWQRQFANGLVWVDPVAGTAVIP